MKRITVFLALLLTLVFACGDGPTPPPKAPTALEVGIGKAVAEAEQPKVADPLDREDVPIQVNSDDAQKGPVDAPVTLVLFTDFQCPFCAKVVPTIKALEEKFGQDLRVVIKNNPLPFHPHAKRAAILGQMIWQTKGSDAFWRYHDKVFASQRGMSAESVREAAIEAGASGADVDGDMLRWENKIERDKDLASKVGANGTPCSFVNGVLVSGAQPPHVFEATVETELTLAKAAIESGTPKSKVVAERFIANFKSPHQDVADDDDAPDTAAWKVAIGKSPVRGKNTALVTIVEFADYQCPFCKKVQPTIESVRTKYGDKVRLVWKDEPLPFHPRAEPAAELARYARATKGDTAFWDVHDRLFSSQPNLDDSDLESIATAAGLDAKKAMAAVNAHTYKKDIDADAGLADDVQASGTPHFFINGRRLVGAVPATKIEAIVDEEIVKAEKLVKAGTAATAVYDELQKDAKGPPEPETKTVKASGSAPWRGTDKAQVVITEFADFQCPFCSRVEPTLDQILKDYPGKVKIVWRNKPLPMHTNAPLAAEAAREAYTQKGNDGFQKYRELLFKNQRALERSDLESYASTVGLDLTKFNAALDNHTHKKAIDDESKAAEDAGITGTPAFTVGPWFVNGAQPYAKFKKLIDRTINGPPPATPPTKLVTKDLTVGTGAGAKNGDTLEVKYVGTLFDGKQFDASKTNFVFELGKGSVIKGWEQGLVGMKVGGKRRLTIPPDLAYGDNGHPPKIPAKSTLIFDVELIGIK